MDKDHYELSISIRFTPVGDEFDIAADDFCLVHRGQHVYYKNPTTRSAIITLFDDPLAVSLKESWGRSPSGM